MRKWHNKKLYNLYSLLDIIVVLTSRMIRWMRHVGQLREIRNALKNFFREAPHVFVCIILWHCRDLDCIASSGRVTDEI
jgi:hypothetical protein